MEKLNLNIFSKRNLGLLLFILVSLLLGSFNWVQPFIHKEGYKVAEDGEEEKPLKEEDEQSK